MEEQTELLREIAQLLRLIAEPAIAKRDQDRRRVLRKIVGKSAMKAKAVFLMDGSRSQSDIRQSMKVDPSDLSKLLKLLRSENLLGTDEKPKLVISVPAAFFDEPEVDDES